MDNEKKMISRDELIEKMSNAQKVVKILGVVSLDLHWKKELAEK